MFFFMALLSYCCLLPRFYCLWSFDYPICPRQDIRRNRQADLLGGFEVYYQLKLRGLLDGKIGGLCTFQDFVDVARGTPEQVGTAHAVCHAGMPQMTIRCPLGELVCATRTAFSQRHSFISSAVSAHCVRRFLDRFANVGKMSSGSIET
jgi:hypothetical protein